MFICAGFGQDTTSFELPIQIGPIVDDLPLLDTLLATVEDTILRKEKKNQFLVWKLFKKVQLFGVF